MKRSSESAEPENGRPKAMRRQEAVSCEFCRKKKLKCDRSTNCSNCRARKQPCSLGLDASESPSLIGAASSESFVPSSQTLGELNSRVKRLEELLASGPDLKNGGQLEPKKDSCEGDEELSRAVSLMETDDFEHVPPLPGHPTCSEARAKLSEFFGSFFFSLTSPRPIPFLEQNLTAILPSRYQGEALLNYYFEKIDWIYRILHVPTVKAIFNGLYAKLEANQQPPYNHLALISTIFASSAYFCSVSSGLYLDRDDAVGHCRRLILLAQDALTAADCLARPSIEMLQSLIIITQWLLPNIGAIATLRTLAGTLIHTARSLSLHLVDSPANKKWRTQNPVDWVNVEVKRRIWWHITSIDWLLSFMGGAQNGTYMIHPNHMNVDYPSNVNDNAINSRGDYARPDDVATEMSFFRFRCKGTKLFREVVDATWEAGDSLAYETVLEFDKKFSDMILEFDRTFDKVKGVLALQNTDETWRAIARTQTYSRMAHFCMDSRFARLHRPYLVRGAKDPKYSYSRMVCLRSARSVIELGNAIMSSSHDLIAFKIWALNHHMYVATVILVMDYCFNRREPRAKERKEEILECFRALKRNTTRGRSTVPGLQKLEKILCDATRGEEGNVSTFSTDWRVTAVEISKDFSWPQKTNQIKPSEHWPEGSMLPVYHPTTPAQGGDFSEGTCQQPWLDFDFNSFESTNFDLNLDTSIFDELFQNLDSNNDLM